MKHGRRAQAAPIAAAIVGLVGLVSIVLLSNDDEPKKAAPTSTTTTTAATTTTALASGLGVPTPHLDQPTDVDDVGTAQSMSADALAVAAWTRAGDQECHCSAEFPWAPQGANAQTRDGTLVHTLTATSPQSPVSLSVMSQPLDSQVDDPTLEQLVTSVITQANASVSSKGFDQASDGVRHFSAVASDDKGSVRLQGFVTNGHLYVLYVGSVDETLTSSIFARFTASFRPA